MRVQISATDGNREEFTKPYKAAPVEPDRFAVQNERVPTRSPRGNN